MATKLFKKIKDVTLPLLKIKPGVEYYVKFSGAMHIGKEMPAKPEVDGKTGEIVLKKKDPAHIAFVKNLETSENAQIIVSTVMRKELDENYPGESYVGKCFGFVITKVEGKDYNLCSIWEVAEPEEEADETEQVLDSAPAQAPALKVAGKKK